ncbi:glycoside hydrolase family 125 protein [Candidatus Contubernalis alkaliaceticus]|uniref:glycoside hydrolase family 125 protein n=1 Tax=Candidatus Contubernalis alkaliaceticus TaxID=338645 RepID=UPI001F4C1832|nr:glycoside hydrolase family 125 protein [Candidatus Contubernalis alkalaceticus]UNC93309.1 glycoside hydrolase family 125 protein [Candidatus Contubernalis alkalaceticus]
MSEDILTVPEEIQDYRHFYLTGNQYISLPDIDPMQGGVCSVNALHLGAKGLLEFRGEAKKTLLSPFIRLEGKEFPLSNKLSWNYLHSWIPAFMLDSKKLQVEGSIYFPPGHRGGVYCLKVNNPGIKPITLEAGFEVDWAQLNLVIFKSRELEVQRRAFFDKWTGSLVMEAGCGLPLVSMALGMAGGRSWHVEEQSPGAQRAVTGEQIYLNPGEEKSIPLYIALNIEGDGAATTVVDLRRHGFQKLFKDTVNWLRQREMFPEPDISGSYNEAVRKVGNEFNNGLQTEENWSIGEGLEGKRTEGIETAGETAVGCDDNTVRSMADQNLFFNFFYALGRTIDTDELIPVTSRSPNYYVSAAFWGRDCLLWSFPGLLLVDLKIAREVLVRVYSHHLDKAGEHAHYINGVLLYPGFELDQLSAYLLALKNYVIAAGDWSIIKEGLIKKGIVTVADKLLSCRDEDTGLFSTFLDPSDDPVKYPFLIYDNGLAQRALDFLADLQENKHINFLENFRGMAEGLKEIIYRLGVVDGPLGPMFAWSVDGEGNNELYDNPPGSLQLLAHYGFCSKEDPVYVNTVKWVNSYHNPYFCQEGKVKGGAASRHAGNPWPLSGVNDLLSLNLSEGSFFYNVTMDNGFFCETVNPSTGRASTGLAFASASGFLAYALWKVYGTRD